MSPVRATGLPGHRRVYILGRRCHHGLVGLTLTAVGAHIGGLFGTPLAAAGAALMWHDRHDIPWCFRQPLLIYGD